MAPEATSSRANSHTPRPLSVLEGFICGALAACTAVTVTNPAEVAKTRLQLQGELQRRGTQTTVYNNVFDTILKTWRNEGLRGIQRGLGLAYIYQVCLNGSRLGLYEPTRVGMNVVLGKEGSDQMVLTSMGAGAASGAVGAILGNPTFLVKARIQAFSPVLPIGTQHDYKSSMDAFRSIWRTEKLKGLFRGTDAAILRTATGASVQLPSYFWAKKKLVNAGLTSPDSTWTFLACSTFSGIMACLVMQPPDTALTRMYNQPTIKLEDGRYVGKLYKNPIDCLWKTVTTEGPLALYKGSTAQFLRLAPHTIITLTMNDIILGVYKKMTHRP